MSWDSWDSAELFADAFVNFLASGYKKDSRYFAISHGIYQTYDGIYQKCDGKKTLPMSIQKMMHLRR